jgi:hypothetical protein
MLLNCHIGCIVLGLLCVGVRLRFGWGGIWAAGFSHHQGAHQFVLTKVTVVKISSVNNCSCASAGSPDTTPAELYPDSNTQQSKNSTTNVAVQQHSHKLLKMDILMPEVSKK